MVDNTTIWDYHRTEWSRTALDACYETSCSDRKQWEPSWAKEVVAKQKRWCEAPPAHHTLRWGWGCVLFNILNGFSKETQPESTVDISFARESLSRKYKELFPSTLVSSNKEALDKLDRWELYELRNEKREIIKSQLWINTHVL